jgi:UDP-N-acetylglucosamine/UDP-N-acetylgalactosamine diphosphorylase
MAKLDEVRRSLDSIGQGHVLRFAAELPDAMLAGLLAQIDAIDLDGLPDLIETYVHRAPAFALPADVDAPPYYPADPSAAFRPYDAAGFRARGEGLLRAGKVACFTVAGGQGSRLGYDGPKGCYPAGAVTRKPLFQMLAEAVLATQHTYGAAVPWYIMTSPLNHDATVAFLAEHRHFGLDPSLVSCFPQGTMPSFDMATGRMLMASRGEIATNPDGHGGSLTAMHVSGALDDMTRRGIEHISYFQIDNPLVRVADPVFLGLHASAPDSSGEMSSKMLPKAYAEEKLGLFATTGGRVCVVEYSDMPMDMQRQTLPDGRLRFLAGSPAIHAFSVGFVRKITTDPGFGLPFHRAEKKIPYIDAQSGRLVKPEAVNGVKLERFVFDALPIAERSIILETSRVEEFAPIKNAEGADSPASCAALQTARAARWLEAAGVRVPRRPDGTPDCVLEISPMTALEPRDLARAHLPSAVEPGASLAL